MSAFKIGFIGLGLIGGSIARALRASMPDIWITVYDIDKNTLALAANDGISNRTSSVIDASFSACDYIFLCAPVSGNAENLTTLKQYLSPSCVLTDVGSVKSGIHERIRALGLDGQFIGGHPMAGSERYGYANSKARLLENAYYILTPTPKTSPDQLKDYERLVVSMGAIPLVLDADQHDYVTAAISHLPHIIASSLVNLVRESDSEDGTMKMIAAGGFKDITRIASSSPVMWQQICLTNKENISKLLGDYISFLSQIRDKIDSGHSDGLYRFFEGARDYRDSFIDASSGPIKKSFSLRIEIADEPGALAAIATILALHQINIKNIGISHNREQEDGVLKVEFYQKEEIEKAREILTAKGYSVYLQ